MSIKSIGSGSRLDGPASRFNFNGFGVGQTGLSWTERVSDSDRTIRGEWVWQGTGWRGLKNSWMTFDLNATNISQFTSPIFLVNEKYYISSNKLYTIVPASSQVEIFNITNSRVTALNSTQIMAAGFNGTSIVSYYSSNNGASWGSANAITTSSLGSGLVCLGLLGTAVRWVAGAGSAIWQSSNNGTLWTNIYNIPVNNSPHSIFSPAASTILVGCSSNSSSVATRIYRGVRAAGDVTSWTFTEVFVGDSHLNTIGRFIRLTNGEIIALQANSSSLTTKTSIIGSIDGGITWTNRSTPFAITDLNSVFVELGDTVVISDSDGYLYSSSDAFRTFNKLQAINTLATGIPSSLSLAFYISGFLYAIDTSTSISYFFKPTLVDR